MTARAAEDTRSGPRSINRSSSRVVALMSTQSTVRLRRGPERVRGGAGPPHTRVCRGERQQSARRARSPPRRGAAPRPDVVPGTAGPVRAAPLPAAAIATCGRGSTSARPSSLRTRATAHAT
jgi:hypothetical protein